MHKSSKDSSSKSHENKKQPDKYELDEKLLELKLEHLLKCRLQRTNSFDRIPDNTEEEKPNPRKRIERLKQPGYKCHICKPYFENLNLNEKDLKLRINKVSRHRGISPVKTPEYYWELDFPNTQECIARNYTSVIPQSKNETKKQKKFVNHLNYLKKYSNFPIKKSK